MAGGRPAKPMFPRRPDGLTTGAVDDCIDGALSYGDAAAFIGVSKRTIERLVQSGELLPVYEGDRARILKRHLQQRLARQLEESRDRRAGVLPPAV